MERLYVVNMHMKCRLCFPTVHRKKSESFCYVLIPIRSQHNAIKVAERSLAHRGSKECCMWHIYAPFWQESW